MSYNLLAENLTGPFEGYCEPEALKFSYRLPRILAEIQDADADILCLQECSEIK